MRPVGVLFLEDALAFLEEIFTVVLHILANQLFNLRSLLKCGLELRQENIFNCSQFFLHLVLLFARFKGVKCLQVLQEHISDENQTFALAIVILQTGCFLAALGRIRGNLTVQIVQNIAGVKLDSDIFRAEETVIIGLLDCFDFFLYLGLNLRFHLVELLQFVVSQLTDLIHFILGHTFLIFHMRLKFLDNDLDSLFLQVFFHQELLGLHF